MSSSDLLLVKVLKGAGSRATVTTKMERFDHGGPLKGRPLYWLPRQELCTEYSHLEKEHQCIGNIG